MATSPNTNSNPGQEPQPLTPEELIDFQKLILDKVANSPKAVKYKSPITGEDKSAAKWVLSQSEEVHVEIGTVHEPGYIEVLVVRDMGRRQGIDTQVIKSYRYYPIAEVSEHDEELVEYYNGKRLIGEELQRAKELTSEVEVDMDEEVRLAIEHAMDFSQRFQGSTLPPMNETDLYEVTAILARCNLENEASPPYFEGI